MTRPIIVLALSIVAALGGWLLFSPDQARAIALQPDDPVTVDRGKTVYVEHCAACHGDQLQGQPNWRVRDENGMLPAPPHDPSGHTWHHADADLFALTKYGIAAVIGQADYQSAMPAYEAILSDEDIIAVLSFIKSTWPKDIQKRHDLINGQAAQQ